MPNPTAKAFEPGLYLPNGSPMSPKLLDGATLPSFIESSLAGIEDYARREPWTFASYVFGVGFILGWKLKPW